MELTETQIKAIKAAVCYKGRRVVVAEFKPMSLNSYWCGGSRDYYFYVTPTGRVLETIPQNGTPFDKLNIKAETLEVGQLLVQTSVYGGKAGPLRIYTPKE